MPHRVRGNSKTSGVTSNPTPFAKIYVHSKIWLQQCVLASLTRHKIAGIRVIKQRKGIRTQRVAINCLNLPRRTNQTINNIYLVASIMYEMQPTAAACTDRNLCMNRRSMEGKYMQVKGVTHTLFL